MALPTYTSRLMVFHLYFGRHVESDDIQTDEQNSCLNLGSPATNYSTKKGRKEPTCCREASRGHESHPGPSKLANAAAATRRVCRSRALTSRDTKECGAGDLQSRRRRTVCSYVRCKQLETRKKKAVLAARLPPERHV